ncbi:MAG: threonine/serine dehydratase [Eubacteriales bacterium]|nr:threonine/serine dehydratase [Eubacteriales bacterium]
MPVSIHEIIPEGKAGVSLSDIQAASKRIRPYVRRTHLLYEPVLSKDTGTELYIKPEMLQLTGAFKVRGAFNKILQLSEEERERGIITSSSGNHAQACAYVGEQLGVKAVVVIPEDAPEVKIRNAKAMGAEVILWDRSYDARWEKVLEESREHGYTMVHGYEDFDIMAGQGTMGLEILEDLPDTDQVLVPIGGGGLISGIATAIKESRPDVKVIGVQTESSDAYYESRKAGHPVSVESRPTLADGITCGTPGENPYPIIEKYVDDIVTVREDSIEEAIRRIADRAKVLAEPASSVGVAALLEGKVKGEGRKTVSLLTSGNWDLEKFAHLFLHESVHKIELKSAK